jgi:hypothetical protein
MRHAAETVLRRRQNIRSALALVSVAVGGETSGSSHRGWRGARWRCGSSSRGYGGSFALWRQHNGSDGRLGFEHWCWVSG